jgi:hypothetical protein
VSDPIKEGEYQRFVVSCQQRHQDITLTLDRIEKKVNSMIWSPWTVRFSFVSIVLIAAIVSPRLADAFIALAVKLHILG